MTYLVQSRQDVGEIDDRLAVLVHLMEYVVAEQFDDVPVAGLGPTGVPRELGAFVDEPKLAEQADETAVLELAHELILEAVGSAGNVVVGWGH